MEKTSDKYFIPKVEDLHIGYECEFYEPGSGNTYLPLTIKLDDPTIWNVYKLQLELGWVRTPYLTKEQIEAEGWEMYSKGIDLWFKFKESPITHTNIQEQSGYKPYNLYLNYGLHDHRLKIRCDFDGGADFNASDTLFEGTCKDINEFRIISKLIGI
jgi:hypothetical protein